MEKLKKTGIIEVVAELEDLAAEQWPKVAAYVFSRSGTLLARVPLEVEKKKSSTGRAKIEIEALRGYLLVKIGPDVDDFRALERYQPSVEKVMIKPGEKKALSFKILKPSWKCWLMSPYLVKGTVETVGGAPICYGEVDIYDIDMRLCFLKLSDSIIERLRNGIIDILLSPPPLELKEPPAYCYEDEDWCKTMRKIPVPPRELEVVKLLEGLPREWSFASERYASLPMARSKMDAALEKIGFKERRALLDTEAVDGVKVSQILYSNTAQFRDLLINNFLPFRFWLCRYPWIFWIWWPYCRWYTLEKIGTAKLKPDGSFSDLIWLSACRNDKPDLWFVVRQEINGIESDIYVRFPIPCHTYWNHPSGTPVHLVVTDERAVACEVPSSADKTGVYVMPLGIGNDGWYEIVQAHIKPADVLDPNRGLYKGSDPYGTRLDIQMQFHDDLRDSTVNVWYYRWSYRKETAADWKPIDTPIVHRYLTIHSGRPVIMAEQLGPQAKDEKSNLFMVPDPDKDWVVISRDDRNFAVWNTSGLPDGMYKLRLEMFDVNGDSISPAPDTFKFFLPTGLAVDGVWPVDDTPHVEADGSIIFQICIDNSDTVADLESVSLGGVPATDCQFIRYSNATDFLDIAYRAYHPHGFLDHYDLSVKRGISGTTVASVSSTTPATTSAVQPCQISDLLRGVGSYGPYEDCSFAIELHTWPRARNGYTRIREYEAHDTSAFALMLKPNTPVVL